MTKPKLCIYHGGCDDGFGSAVIVNSAYADIEFHAGEYGVAPPDVTDKDVIIVDFSYKRHVLEQMLLQCNSMIILDHHKTAKEDLETLNDPKLILVFDMARSGAGITWDYFIGGPRPLLVRYLEDRDLWKKELPNSDEFTIALRSYLQDFTVWDLLLKSDTAVASLITEGPGIQRYYRRRVEELKKNYYMANLGGHDIAICNAPYFAASEVAGELASIPGATFGASYFEVSKGKYQYSLRSRGEFDVSAVAKMFGGGGHKNAAGISNTTLLHI